MSIIDIVESGINLIALLIKGAGTILALLLKGVFVIMYLFIVLWALLIVIGVGYTIIVTAFSQMHPHLP